MLAPLAESIDYDQNKTSAKEENVWNSYILFAFPFFFILAI